MKTNELLSSFITHQGAFDEQHTKQIFKTPVLIIVNFIGYLHKCVYAYNVMHYKRTNYSVIGTLSH